MGASPDLSAHDVECSVSIAAPPERVYSLVADLTRMGEWSPENTGGRWLGDATGPETGVRFRGSNRKGLRRWSTTCTVTATDRGKRFAFDVKLGPLAISTWEYIFRPEEGGTKVTEAWTDRRAAWLRVVAVPVMGIPSRPDHNRRGMERTLATLKAAAENPAAGR